MREKEPDEQANTGEQVAATGNQSPWAEDQFVAERAIMLHLTTAGRDERWSAAELRATVYDIDWSVMMEALKDLELHGLLVLHERYVFASRAAFRLDELGMISI